LRILYIDIYGEGDFFSEVPLPIPLPSRIFGKEKGSLFSRLLPFCQILLSFFSKVF
jgi:hypothetical protein